MLSWFRKNQKIMLGVFGVGLMFVFTVSLGSGVDPIMDRLSGRTSGGPSTEVAVTWDGGQLDTQSLDRLRVQRNLLGRFMGTVGRLAQERGGQQKVSMLPLYSGDRSLLELEILANEAEKMGIAINDETVIDYLNQLTDGTILPSEYAQILRESTGGNLPENALFPLLARELKAQKVRGLVQSGHFPASPIAAWDYYNRLNRLIKAEIMPIAVDDFMGQVDEPTDAEVTEMFEKYKRYYPMPMSPEPGFRQREKRAFQYVKVNYDAILENEKKTITDEEIKKYYDENKEQYLIQEDGDLDLGGLPSDDATTEATDDTSPSESSNTDEGPSVTSELDSEEANQTPSPTPSPTALPQEEETTDSIEGEKSAETVEQVTESTSDSELASDNPLQKATEEAANEIGAEAGEVVAETAEAVAEAQTEIQDAVADDGEPSGENDSSEITNSTKSADETPDTATIAEEVDNSDLDSIASYKELSEVADDIRQSLAAPRAQVKMKKMLETVSRDMERYFQDRTLWEMDVEEKPDLPAPTMPDFSEIVDGNQAILGEIGLTDRLSISENEIGQAFDIAIYSRENIQRVTFADTAYLPSVSPYRPSVFPKLDMATDRYVYWMTEKTDEYIPELDEVRAEVVEACKRKSALEVAKKEAASLVAKAEQANSSLQESLSSDKYTEFIDTGEVSWVTAPLQEGATPSITPIIGAEDAGPELRKKLFHLQPGGISYATNMPKDKVYVFRVVEESPDVEVRREQFLKNGVDAPVLFLARRESMIGLSEWYRDLTSKYDIDWQRDPQSGQNGDL